MSEFTHIDVLKTKALLDAGAVTIVDIRDLNSFDSGHMKTAIQLNNDGLSDFIKEADLELPLVVVCYHGNSSQGAAEFLSQQGFSDVYSMDGGFAAWARSFPIEVHKS